MLRLASVMEAAGEVLGNSLFVDYRAAPIDLSRSTSADIDQPVGYRFLLSLFENSEAGLVLDGS
jgi:hypothetical protein